MWSGELGSRHFLMVIVTLIMLMQCAALLPVQTGAHLLYCGKSGWVEYDVRQAQSSSWLHGWYLRKAHNITGAAGAGANYQVTVTVHYGAGNDSNRDMYCNSLCKPNFDDIRFTDDDGVTLLHYWRQESVPFDQALFWVEVADNLDSLATIYVYYCNVFATSTSNGDATFTFFDDFTGGLNKWNLNEYGQSSQVHSYDLASGKLHVYAESNTSYSTSGYMFETKRTFNSSGAAGFRIRATGGWKNLTEENSAGGFIQYVALYDGNHTGTALRLCGIHSMTVSCYQDNETPVCDWYLPVVYTDATTWFDYRFDCSLRAIDMSIVVSRPGYSGEAWLWMPNFTVSSYKIRLWAIVQSWSGLVKVDSYYNHVFLTKWTPNWPWLEGSWGTEEKWSTGQSGQQAALSMNMISAIITIGSLAIIVVFSTQIFEFRRNLKTPPLQSETHRDEATDSHQSDG